MKTIWKWVWLCVYSQDSFLLEGKSNEEITAKDERPWENLRREQKYQTIHGFNEDLQVTAVLVSYYSPI